jgi:hypothetical protein
MGRRAILTATLSLACWACTQPAPEQQATENAHRSAGAGNRAMPPSTEAIGSEAVESRAGPAELKRPIDPTSAEAAGQVVQSYGALIEQKRWKEADALWGDAGSAAKFEAELAEAPNVHIEIGNLGELEGAAGSIYVTMPVIFYGDLKDGQPFRRFADVILRRVNDVPGSTEAQRRWHIERIDWKDAP